MIMANFLKSRKSVRDFKKKKIDPNTLEELALNLKEFENEEGSGNIKFRLYENGELLYGGLKGLGGYSGVMIESPHYILLELKNDDEKTIIYSAYYAEKLITKLNEMGISTCWVSILGVDENKKKEILGDDIVIVNHLLAIGYEKPKNPFVQDPFSERIGVEDLVFEKGLDRSVDMEDLETRGLGDLFFYARFAPSTKNLQPWRFVLDGPIVKLLIAYKDGEKPLFEDAGIIMYYFEALANTQGIKNKWKLIDGNIKKAGLNYKYIGEYHL